MNKFCDSLLYPKTHSAGFDAAILNFYTTRNKRF